MLLVLETNQVQVPDARASPKPHENHKLITVAVNGLIFSHLLALSSLQPKLYNINISDVHGFLGFTITLILATSLFARFSIVGISVMFKLYTLARAQVTYFVFYSFNCRRARPSVYLKSSNLNSQCISWWVLCLEDRRHIVGTHNVSETEPPSFSRLRTKSEHETIFSFLLVVEVLTHHALC